MQTVRANSQNDDGEAGAAAMRTRILPPSFRGAPPGPRKARPDDRLSASPESILPNGGYGFRACAKRRIPE
jgi:hypothetical protein